MELMEGEESPAPAMVAVLMDDVLLALILKRLCPTDLVRAALTNRHWRRAAALAVPRAPPLSYLFYAQKDRSAPPMASAQLPPVFVPSDCGASSPRLSLALAADEFPRLAVCDVNLGLVLLLPRERPEMRLLRILVVDPASRRRALLPPPPRDALPDDQWRQTRRIIGAAVLSRAHPSQLSFQAVCITIDGDRPRAWVAFVKGDDCRWCVLPTSKQARDQFDPNSFDQYCVHDQAKIYWHMSVPNRLLALDPLSLEFFFLPAPAHLQRYYIASTQLFPYYLCWPPAFLSSLEKQDDTWTENTMSLVRIALYNISYIRGLFADEYFTDMPMLPSGMQIKSLVPMDDESQRFSDWLEKGAYDAVKKKFLRAILFCISEESGPLLEEYCLSFFHSKEIVMDLRLTGSAESIWTLRSDAAENLMSQIWIPACSLVQKLSSLISSLRKIPEERVIGMKLLYFDELTPVDSEPPFFQSYDDMKRCCQGPPQTNLQDIPQGITSLHTYDARSVLCNNRCLANKDLALDSDSETQQGHLCCITKKGVTFYFDSGATRHTCGDNKLIKNLHEVPVECRSTVYDADCNKVHLVKAGDLTYNQIKLSPVFYDQALNYNVIALGELDDANTLIYVGDRRVKNFDTKRGVLIGDGYLHQQRNEYVVRSITYTREEPQVIIKSTGLSSMPIDKKTWALDSLCCNHMTGNRKLLRDIRSKKRSFVTPRGTIKSLEIGSVKTSTITLFNVFYCPGLRESLISEGQLDREGYSCTRLAHKCTIQWRDTQKTVGIAHQDLNAIYYVEYFHSGSGPSPKHPTNDGEHIQRWKRPRQEKRIV